VNILDDIPPVLAEGWSELIGVLVIFGLYAAGAIAKMFSNRKRDSETDKSSESSYVVELAKKRTRQRQEQARIQHAQAAQASVRKPRPVSEWDRTQEAKRRRREQLRQQTKQQKPAQPARTYQQQKPAPKPVRRPQPARTMTDYMQEAWTAITSGQMQAQAPRTVETRQPKRQPVPQRVQNTAKVAKLSKRLTTEVPAATQSRLLENVLKSPQDLRTAIVLKEILDKPVALRANW